MIYVERVIRGDLEEVWTKTQDPKLHERWDLRFTSIEYMPHNGDGNQRFTYSTKLGFGLRVDGWGESVGERLADGTRTSALKFGSNQAISLILDGSGYWKYEQQENTVRFHTVYEYRVRFGAIGKVFDRLVFRPMIAWATALSFDRVGLWVERGLDPEATLRTWLVHCACKLTLVFIWVYHGLIPKLLTHQPAEASPLLDFGIRPELANTLVNVAGVAEILFGLAFLVQSRQKWPWFITLFAMPALALGAVIRSPERAMAPFNPVTFNLAIFCVAFVGLLTLEDAPSAKNCKYSANWKPK